MRQVCWDHVCWPQQRPPSPPSHSDQERTKVGQKFKKNERKREPKYCYLTSQSPDHVPLPCFISLYFVDATSICIHAISASLPFPRAYHGLHQCNLFMAVLPRGVLYGGDLFGVVRWAPLLTSTSERRDRRSCVCDLKRKETWWRSHDSHLACSELRRPVLHGIS